MTMVLTMRHHPPGINNTITMQSPQDRSLRCLVDLLGQLEITPHRADARTNEFWHATASPLWRDDEQAFDLIVLITAVRPGATCPSENLNFFLQNQVGDKTNPAHFTRSGRLVFNSLLPGNYTLHRDGMSVLSPISGSAGKSDISEDYAEAVPPNQLDENANRMFQGSILLGDGFFLTYEQAEQMVANDYSLAKVIFPVISALELNEPTQKPNRKIINFHDWSKEDASQYREAFARVELLVKPERSKRGMKRNWWQFAKTRPELYRKSGKLDFCFATAKFGKYLNFCSVPKNCVFTDSLCIFTTDHWDDYAIVESTLHEVWARKHSPTLMRVLIYSLNDCFATFPFPHHSEQHKVTLEKLGETFHEHRRELMRDLWLGVTDICNLFHRSDLTPALVGTKSGDRATINGNEGLNRLLSLREDYRELDQAVLNAYGWGINSDFGPALDLRHDFYDVECLPENDRTRYTVHPDSRREILSRLLKLNHQRAVEEEARGRLEYQMAKKASRAKAIDELL